MWLGGFNSHLTAEALLALMHINETHSEINGHFTPVSLILSAGEGELFAWGKNRVGTLGLAHNKDQFFPFKVSSAILCEALFTHQTLWSFHTNSSI